MKLLKYNIAGETRLIRAETMEGWLSEVLKNPDDR